MLRVESRIVLRNLKETVNLLLNGTVNNGHLLYLSVSMRAVRAAKFKSFLFCMPD